MRLLKYLQEEYVTSFNFRNKYVEFLEFPTKNEFIKFRYEAARFIIDPKKENVYGWDALMPVTHSDGKYLLKINHGYVIYGLTKIVKGEIKDISFYTLGFNNIDQIKTLFSDKFLNKVLKYFNITKDKFLNNITLG